LMGKIDNFEVVCRRSLKYNRFINPSPRDLNFPRQSKVSNNFLSRAGFPGLFLVQA
jgi:hypothetical protein